MLAKFENAQNFKITKISILALTNPMFGLRYSEWRIGEYS